MSVLNVSFLSVHLLTKDCFAVNQLFLNLFNIKNYIVLFHTKHSDFSLIVFLISFFPVDVNLSHWKLMITAKQCLIAKWMEESCLWEFNWVITCKKFPQLLILLNFFHWNIFQEKTIIFTLSLFLLLFCYHPGNQLFTYHVYIFASLDIINNNSFELLFCFVLHSFLILSMLSFKFGYIWKKQPAEVFHGKRFS